MKIRMLWGALFAVSAALSAFAQNGDAKPVDAKITQMEGRVSVKRPAEEAWSPGAVDAMLPENSEIATSVKSGATLLSTEDITITVKSSSLVKLTRSALTEQVSATKLDLKYGVLEVDVKRTTGRANLLSIRAPNATTSISGTKVIIFALGIPMTDLMQSPGHALVMFKEGEGLVARDEDSIVIVVGAKEALMVLATLPVDNLLALAGTTEMPFLGMVDYESGTVVDGLIVGDILTLGEPYAGLVPGSSTNSNPVTINQESGSILPGPPPPPPVP